jgi:DNA-binding NtrC family response regulator
MRTPSSSGPLIEPRWIAFLEPISRLYTTNPFDPAWEVLQKAALGALGDDVPEGATALHTGGVSIRLVDPLATALTTIAGRLGGVVPGTPREIEVYRGAVFCGLWARFGEQLQGLVTANRVDVPFLDEFLEGHRILLGHPGISAPEPGHLLALLYQRWRAWYFAATKIAGRSPSAAAARAAIFQANMTSDVCAYAMSLYRTMDEVPVLITGETGTGKELAAECIGWSRYIPLDLGARRFAGRYGEDFHARNVCAVPGELLEGTLFGHRRGAFTGASANVPGLLAMPKANGTLFIDEAGEIPLHVQVKLLRPFQSREFVPLGDVQPQKMQGRLVFATHRDMEALCQEDKFRPDLFERMNGVHVHMPAVRQLIAEAPWALREYARWFVAEKIDDPAQVDVWTDRVMAAIQRTRADYPWPRNFRELKHFTERIIISGGDVPAPTVSVPVAEPSTVGVAVDAPPSTPAPNSILGRRALAGEVSLDEVIRAFVTWMYVLSGRNKTEAARRMGRDWRTVGRWLDLSWLARRIDAKK